MVIFYSYVSLPEGNMILPTKIGVVGMKPESEVLTHAELSEMRMKRAKIWI